MLHQTLRLLLARGVAAAARKPHIVSPGRKTKLAVLGLKMLQSMQRFQVRALNLEAVGSSVKLAHSHPTRWATPMVTDDVDTFIRLPISQLSTTTQIEQPRLRSNGRRPHKNKVSRQAWSRKVFLASGFAEVDAGQFAGTARHAAGGLVLPEDYFSWSLSHGAPLKGRSRVATRKEPGELASGEKGGGGQATRWTRHPRLSEGKKSEAGKKEKDEEQKNRVGCVSEKPCVGDVKPSRPGGPIQTNR
ncbi:RNA-dependent RNA polymerase 1 [Fusarium oxysporum f. sp. albedinis]|nr:RNA-dependent RNA polymerase 1 [Fusarium oxysporum f. sp. albedinis]